MERDGKIKCESEKILDLMRQVDYVFEMCLTDNVATDLLFKSSHLASNQGDYKP